MPLQLPPLSRRRFLAGSLAAGAGLLGTRWGLADERPVDPNRFILMADTHIWERRDEPYRGIKPADHLAQARDQFLALDPRPAHAMIVGDCVFLQGHAADYAVLADVVRPIHEAGLPLTFLMGNHDNREACQQAFGKIYPQTPLVEGKRVALVESPHVNFFLLDSLEKTDWTPGVLGEAQLQWLADALDERADKPAVVAAHHNPDSSKLASGLRDTDALFEIFASRKQVKAYLYGHTHRWERSTRDAVHLVNVPAMAWLFDPKQPRGWLEAEARAEGMTLVLHALDPAHPAHGERVELEWRKA